MKVHTDPNIPSGAGHYSTCIESNGFLFVSGQLPTDIETGKVPDTIEEQTLLVLQKIVQIVTAAGSSQTGIVQMRIYISDGDLWGKVNAVYAEFFGTHKPVRAIIPVGKLHYGCLIEAEAMAEL